MVVVVVVAGVVVVVVIVVVVAVVVVGLRRWAERVALDTRGFFMDAAHPPQYSAHRQPADRGAERCKGF